MKYTVIHPYLSDYFNCYFCVIHGNDCVAINERFDKIYNICKRFAKKGVYTELWYTNESGESFLCNYWN